MLLHSAWFLPSMYTMVTTWPFVGAIKLHGNEFVSYLNDQRELPLLQTPYRLVGCRTASIPITIGLKFATTADYSIDVQ